MTADPDLERHPLRQRILATLDRAQSLSELAASRNPAGSRQVLPEDAVHHYEQAIADRMTINPMD